MNPALVVEKKHPFPILIVDKVGIIGEALALCLSEEALVVLVSHKQVSKENIIHVPYHNKFPVIPDSAYSYIFAVDDNVSSTREALPSFLKKAKNDSIPILYIGNIYEVGSKLIESICGEYRNARVALYGDVFYLEDPIFSNSLNKLIHNAVKHGRVSLPGSGLEQVFPVTFKDLILGLLEASFGTDKMNKIYLLFPEHEVTLLSFAKNLLRVNPNLKLDFAKEEKAKLSPQIPHDGKYLFENYPLDKKIKDQEILEIDEKKTLHKKQFKFNPKKNKSIYFAVLGSLLLLLLLPVVATIIFSLFGLYNLNQSKKAVEQGKIDSALTKSFLAEQSFSIAKAANPILTFQMELVGRRDFAEKLTMDINRGINASSGLRSFVLAVDSFSSILDGTTINSAKKIQDGISNLKEFLAFLEREKLEEKEIAKYVTDNQGIFTFATSIVETSPRILGLDGTRKYLVLFQNNMELRPGGGFIGSYGILTFNNGKFDAFKIHDVYDADGQLKGHVEPPFAIRRYLQIPHLYMRDSNFDVDFSKAASKVASMYVLETGEKVDGVIGVDLLLFKKILDATGPVFVQDYNERVDSSNFFYLTETHAEKNFFPGSTQKKDFLRSLYEAVRTHLEQKKETSYLKVAKAIEESLLEKHLLFAFNDSSIQGLFTANNWSSTLWDGRKEGQNQVLDFFAVNEANIGVNKANYFVTRSLGQKVTIDNKGEIQEEVTLSIRDDGDVWPGGDYLAYVRLILPKNTELLEIEIDKEKQKMIPAVTDFGKYESKSFKKPEGLEIEKSIQNEKDVYGFLTLVKSKKMQIIKASYKLARKVSTKETTISYSQRIMKQPGVDNFPYAFSIKVPDKYNIVTSLPGLVKEGSTGNYSTILNGDKDLNLIIVKQ